MELNTGVPTRKTYPQAWAAYNAAQTSEKAIFLKLLHDLCAGIEEAKQIKGRPRIPINDALFAVCYKIYSTVSGRRFMTDLRTAQADGYIDRTPHFNSLFNVLQNPNLTPILKQMVVETGKCMAILETDFAADSSGFGASRYDKWFDHKYGQKVKQAWVKAHVMIGVKSHIITAVEIAGQNTHDSKMLPPLVNRTAENFTMREVSADKGYSSIAAHALIADVGAVPFIAFKRTATGRGIPQAGSHRGGALWRKMHHLFSYRQEEFAAHYHKRSNVESVFSMVKAKFGGSVRSKTDIAAKNEVLCKFICHNICVLIQEMHELGIDPEFWRK